MLCLGRSCVHRSQIPKNIVLYRAWHTVWSLRSQPCSTCKAQAVGLCDCTDPRLGYAIVCMCQDIPPPPHQAAYKHTSLKSVR